MEPISYKLPNFEGPLDLLLYLVRKNKLNIYDIPIVEVLEQYMDAIRQMREVSMEIASEFLDMAARLVQIKSAMLLPRQAEKSERMRRELSGELIEYHICREMAQKLSYLAVGSDIFVRGPMPVPAQRSYRRRYLPSVLRQAYLSAAGKARPVRPVASRMLSAMVSRRVVSVSSKITFVWQKLSRHRMVRYGSLFTESRNRSELVAVFLALLELMKTRRIAVDGEGKNATVSVMPGALPPQKEGLA